ncbi:AmmeMemoRadiSam system protein B [Candidatus Micrarchaeota archaeon]|nr:AmmeMemoRadiSam system protein B [Candidatus Micrarchaeota archaeon]
MIRQPAVAGAFYPADPEELREMIEKMLEDAEVEAEGMPRGLVEPHAGYVYSGPVAAYGYKLLSGYSRQIKKVFLLGPSHYGAFFGAVESGAEKWKTPLGEVDVGSIRKNAENKELFTVNERAHSQEHSLEVQVPFLQEVLGDFTLYPLLVSDAVPMVLADELSKHLDENSIVIASSDLSHYNDYNTAVRLDSVANETVPALQTERFKESGDACGKIPILVLMHLAKKMKWGGKLLDYRNSGDTAGPKDRVVGYGCYAFFEGL